MIVNLINQLDSITLSVGEIFLGIFIFIAFLALIFFMYSICKKRLQKLNRKGFLAFKSFLVAIGPILFQILALINKPLPDKVYIIIILISIIVIFIWNIISIGLFYGILYTILNICLGALASIGFLIALGFAIVGIGGIISSIMDGDSKTTKSGTTSSTTSNNKPMPEYVTNANNETIYVEKGLYGQRYVNGKILRKSDFENRYYDDDGNYYVSYDN